MATVGGIVIDMVVNSAQVAVGMTKVAASVDGGQRQINTGLAKIERSFSKLPDAASRAGAAVGKGLALAVTGAIIALPAVIARVTDRMDELGDKANEIGVSAERLQTFRFAMEQLGSSAESADTGLAKFVLTLGKARLGDGAASDFFAKLGLDPQKIGSTDQALTAVLQKLGGVKDGAQRAALANAGFGRAAGGELAGALSQGSAAIADQEARLRSLGGVVTNESVAKLGELKNTFTELKGVFTASLANAIAQNKDQIAILLETIAASVPRIVSATTALFNFFGVASRGGSSGSVSAKRIELQALNKEIAANNKTAQSLSKPINRFNSSLSSALGNGGEAEARKELATRNSAAATRKAQLEKEIAAEEAAAKRLADARKATSIGLSNKDTVLIDTSNKVARPARSSTPKAATRDLDSRIGSIVAEEAAFEQAADDANAAAQQAYDSANERILNLQVSVLAATGKEVEAIKLAAEQEKQTWQELAASRQISFEQAANATILIEQRTAAEVEAISKRSKENAASGVSEFSTAFSAATTTALEDAILNFESLNDVASSFGKTLLQVALRILVIQPLVKALASAMDSVLGGGSGSGGGGNLASTLVGGFLSLIGVGKAAGGQVAKGNIYPVGERGPELFVPSSNGTIINAAQSSKLFGVNDNRAANQTVINVDARYSQDPETTRQMAYEAIQTAMPQIMRDTRSDTIGALARERM
jgi:hypothetical protein